MDTQLATALIRRAVLGETESAPPPLGAITLHAHQSDAVRRLLAAVRRYGGALLADDPGMGKTFVALAVAREFARPVVFAPAAVRDPWARSRQLAQVPATFVSLERMSRRSPPQCDADLVIIDEAQHVGAQGTARRQAIAAACAGRAVLLLSATPVRNRLTELEELLALFLGSAARLDAEMLSRCIVRRQLSSARLPTIVTAPPLVVPRTPTLEREIRALPAAVPLQEGGTAGPLVAMGLLHARGSSVAALGAALRRRLQRGEALAAALAQGEWPNAAELRRWLVGDDTVQLRFALDPPRADTHQWHETLRAHCEAVRALIERARAVEGRDTAGRAALLRGVLRAHPDVPIIAFAQHAATVRALYRELRGEPHVVLLTADGAHSAGGRRARADVIAALAPGGAARRPSHDRVHLVLTTDVLSEGVNLQGAGVVVHFDLPWTPARVRQRTGRVARMGSEQTTVFEYVVAQSREVARTMGMQRRHKEKARAGARATAASDARERLRELVGCWPSNSAALADGASHLVIGSVQGMATGFLAVVESAGERVLVGGTRFARTVTLTTDPARLVRIVAGVSVPIVPARVSVSPRQIADVLRALTRLLQHRGALAALDASGPRTALRRRLMRRAMDVLPRTPVAARAAAAAAIAQLRLALRQAPAAGVEPVLERVLQEPVAHDLQWLARTSAALAALATPRRETTRGGPPAHTSGHRPIALLLISPRRTAE